MGILALPQPISNRFLVRLHNFHSCLRWVRKVRFWPPQVQAIATLEDERGLGRMGEPARVQNQYLMTEPRFILAG